MKSSVSTEDVPPKKAAETAHPLFERKKEVLQVFPEALEEYAKAEKVINRARCTSCGRNNQHTRMLDVLAGMWNGRDLSKLKGVLPDMMLKRIRGEYTPPPPPMMPPDMMRAIISDPSDDIRGRPPCFDCTHKHLAQALILLREAEMGYPEHVEYALQHLQNAESRASVSVKAELSMVASALLKFKKTGIQKGAGHLTRARELLEDRLKRDEKLTRSLVIGHLSEAADECVNGNPELARMIREERLNFMNLESYDPPLGLLIDKAVQG